jgi:arginase
MRVAVQAAISTGRLPLVLAGSCDAAIGVVAGLGRGRCGVIWIDAHADFNTPASSASGFSPACRWPWSPATATGSCGHRWMAARRSRTNWSCWPGCEASPPAEARRLQHSAIHAIPWRQGRPQGDLVAVMEQLAGQVDEVYLHIDNDAFDPHTAPGIVDEPVPGGLSLAQMEALIGAVTARLPIAAATIATYTPARDQQDRTLHADLRIIELLDEYAAQH